jgi:hypothetical protein
MGWQNSDDTYLPNCFVAAAAASATLAKPAVIYGQVTCVNAGGRVVRENRAREFRLEDGIPWFDLANQCLFFPAAAFRAGLFLDEEWHHCMDAEFYWRLIIAGFPFHFVPAMGGHFRLHEGAKTARQQHVNVGEANELFSRILSWQSLPPHCRTVALERYRAFLSTSFDHGLTDEFIRGLRTLMRCGGWRALRPGIIARAVTMLGGAPARRLHLRLRRPMAQTGPDVS